MLAVLSGPHVPPAVAPYAALAIGALAVMVGVMLIGMTRENARNRRSP